MTEPASLIEGAAPFELGEGEKGVLLVHGFTGSPQSMRLWGESLAEAGFSVKCPLLPGHGTRWEDMQETKWRDWTGAAQEALDDLSARCAMTFIAGLSMGGAIACYLAAENQDAVAGISTVGAAVLNEDPRAFLLPVLKHLLPSLPGVSNDIAEPGMAEVAYDRTPLRAAAELLSLQRATRERLSRIGVPALLFHSRDDHVVPASNMSYLAKNLGSNDVRLRWLERSYHVATLDYDRHLIFEESAAFFNELASESR
ncbi:MAG: esterase [Acidobacteria bacterium]|nr:MAG: esterase [Acidobacteriota bacterium]